jgi:transposase
MIHLHLSEEEVNLLHQHNKFAGIDLVRSKAQAILLRSQDILIKPISFTTNRSERTIERWLDDFQKRRMSSIFSGKADNENACKLTKEQKLEIKKVIGQPPDKYGIPKEFWSVPKLKDYVSAQFGVVYESDISYHYLLRFAGLDLKYPDKLSPRRNEKVIKTRMQEIKKEIKPFLKDPNWTVLAADETRLQLEAEIRRAWLVKGKRTIVKTERSNEHQNYLGFLDQKTGECQVFSINRGNQTETIRVLKILMGKYPNQKVCVIWDNARWHDGKVLKAELVKKKKLKNLYLINMPPYAPDHNPIEHVWQYAKSKIANRGGSDFKTIKQDFLDHINNRKFDYKI